MTGNIREIEVFEKRLEEIFGILKGNFEVEKEIQSVKEGIDSKEEDIKVIDLN